MDGFWIILTASLIAINCALLGSFLVLKKMSMIGDALSHAVLPGIVVAFLFTGEYNSFLSIILSSVFGLAAVLLMNFLSRKGAFQKDASIGIMYTFLFSIGIILVSSYAKNADIDVDCVLFGDIGNLPFMPSIELSNFYIPNQSITIAALTILIITIVVKGIKGFSISSFDPLLAASMGINVLFWDSLLLGLTSINTVLSFDAVGAIMVISLLVLPPAFASLFTKTVNRFLKFAVVFAVVNVIAGYYISMILDLNIVASMSFLMGALFLVTLLLVGKKKQTVNY